MSAGVVARAPGKIILFGEHAVVYGEPALGLSLSREVRVSLLPGAGRVRVTPSLPRAQSKDAATPSELVRAALGSAASAWDCDVTLGVPPMAGLGSSAALAIALLRAREQLQKKELGAKTMLEEAIRVENVAHGSSSGVDPAICMAGGLIAYERTAQRITRVTAGAPLYLVIGTQGGHGGTRGPVGGVAVMKERAPELIRAAMAALGECSRAGRKAIERGELADAGRAMDLAHGILSGFGLVSEETEALVRRARAEGALGAKMSGAGGAGGAFVALAPDQKTAERIAGALAAAGAGAWVEAHGEEPRKAPAKKAPAKKKTPTKKDTRAQKRTSKRRR